MMYFQTVFIYFNLNLCNISALSFFSVSRRGCPKRGFNPTSARLRYRISDGIVAKPAPAALLNAAFYAAATFSCFNKPCARGHAAAEQGLFNVINAPATTLFLRTQIPQAVLRLTKCIQLCFCFFYACVLGSGFGYGHDFGSGGMLPKYNKP
ncbi:hypothetical protein [Neisseria yangbaofengii]|uniref:hypothetical protein n=1 Tax=Neisseria yangbaofengii TaxID=2709396 RepID=UPI0013EB1105|nr:hypothetical protein [Neisseria yangbaofengii]